MLESAVEMRRRRLLRRLLGASIARSLEPPTGYCGNIHAIVIGTRLGWRDAQLSNGGGIISFMAGRNAFRLLFASMSSWAGVNIEASLVFSSGAGYIKAENSRRVLMPQ